MILIAARFHREVQRACTGILSRRRACHYLELIDRVQINCLRHQAVVSLLIDRLCRESVQVELAEKVSCSRQTIISIENAKFIPSVELSLRIAKALGVNVEEIFYLEEEDT